MVSSSHPVPRMDFVRSFYQLRLIDLYPTVAMSATSSFNLFTRQHFGHFVIEDLVPFGGLPPFLHTCHPDPTTMIDIGVTFVL